MLPLIVRPALVESAARAAEQPRRQRLGRHHLLRARGRRRHLRPARRLPHRPLRPPARARLEHPALRVLRVRRRLFDVGRTGCCSGAAARSSASASSSSPRSPGWRSCSRTRSSARRSSATRRRSDRSAASWSTGAYYLVVTYGARAAGRARRPRSVALHADVGRHPGDSADPHPAVPAGIAGLAAEESGRHAQAPELRRAVPAAIPPHDDRHDDHDGVRVRRGVRRHSADAAHRARPAGSARRCRARRSRADRQRRAVVSGVRRARRPHSCSRSSPSASSAGAGCCTSSRFPG